MSSEHRPPSDSPRPPKRDKEPSPGRQIAAVDSSPRAALHLVDSSPLRMPLGEVLLRDGAIDEKQLAYALTQQKQKPMPLGELLVRLGFVTDAKMRQALGRQLQISYIDLDRLSIDKTLTRTVNIHYARRHSLVPVSCTGDTLTVCIDDPTNRAVLDELARITGLVVTPVTSSRDAIARAFKRLYRDAAAPAAAADPVDLVVEDANTTGTKNRYVEEREVKKADAIVRQLLWVAIKRRASDIHLEMLALAPACPLPHRRRARSARLRASLQEACNKAVREFVSRIKILAQARHRRAPAAAGRQLPGRPRSRRRERRHRPARVDRAQLLRRKCRAPAARSRGRATELRSASRIMPPALAEASRS